MLRYFSFLAVILGANSALAPFIKPCKTSNNACVLASAQAAVPFLAPGIPALGVPSLDPMVLDLVKGENSGLELTLKNTTVTGMKGCSVDAVKHDISKGKQVSTIRCSVVLTGEYKMSGKLIVLPISGEGKHTIKIRDIVIKAYTEVGTVQGADGNPHWRINKWRHTFSVLTDTHFNFENLFNGNQALAGPVLQFANSNWRDVMQEIAPPVVQAIVARVVAAVQALYSAVPVHDLSLQ